MTDTNTSKSQNPDKTTSDPTGESGPKSARPPRARRSRTQRTLASLFAICVFGAVLAAWNVYSSHRDLALATGPAGSAQRAFFLDVAQRPDASAFFKSLTPVERTQMVTNIGRYDDPGLAKLCSICLNDFDENVRRVLTVDLGRIARRDPAAVADELAGAGSFQNIAISSALRSIGPSVLPTVAKELKRPEARVSALEFLIGYGDQSSTVLCQALDDADPEVRMAVAETLGRIRSSSAVPSLLRKWQATHEGGRPVTEEGFAYLSALAAIATPDLEPLLSRELERSDYSLGRRALIALGLGKIGGPKVVDLLWSFAKNTDPGLKDSAIEALQECGDEALTVEPVDADTRLRVASALHSARSDQVILQSLSDPALRITAARFAGSRASLVNVLGDQLRHTSGDDDGQFCAVVIRSLSQTSKGKQLLETFEGRPDLGGLISRQRAMGADQNVHA